MQQVKPTFSSNCRASVSSGDKRIALHSTDRTSRSVGILAATIRLAANIPIAVVSFLFLMAGGGSYLLTLDPLTGACNQIFSRSKYGRGGGQKSPEIGPRDRLGPAPFINRNNSGFFRRKLPLFQQLGFARDCAASSRNLLVEAIPGRSSIDAEASSK